MLKRRIPGKTELIRTRIARARDKTPRDYDESAAITIKIN